MIAGLMGMLAMASATPQAINPDLQRIATVLNKQPSSQSVTFRNATVEGNMLSAEMVSSVEIDMTTSEIIAYVRKGFCSNSSAFKLQPGSPVEYRLSLTAPHLTYPLKVSVRAIDCDQSHSELSTGHLPAPPKPMLGVAGSAFDFKGVPLGITYDAFRRLPHPDGDRAQVSCTGDKVSSWMDLTVIDDVEKRLGVRHCIWTLIDGDGVEADLGLAGTSMSTASYHFAFVPDPKDGVLRLFKLIATSVRPAVPVVVEALTAKYGRAKVTKGTAQTRLGNSIEQETVEWSKPSGSIKVVSPAMVTYDMAIIMSDARLAKYVEDQKAATRAAVPNGI
jgi:hypothetical protein